MQALSLTLDRQLAKGKNSAASCTLLPSDAIPIRRRYGAEPLVTPAPEVATNKEVTMTRRIRLSVAAVLAIAATGLMVALAVTATTGVNHTPAHVYLAGIALNALD